MAVLSSGLLIMSCGGDFLLEDAESVVQEGASSTPSDGASGEIDPMLEDNAPDEDALNEGEPPPLTGEKVPEDQGGDGPTPVPEEEEEVDSPPSEEPVETPPEQMPPVDAEPSVPMPFVLVHGFAGFAAVGEVDGFFEVEDFLEALTIEGESVSVFAASLPPIAGGDARTEALGAFVDETLLETGADKVFLICHSQGGLDCRALVSSAGYSDRVQAIVTIGTPHQGTPLADLAAAAPEGLLNPAGQFLAALLGLAETPPTDVDWDAGNLVESVDAADVQGAIAAMTAEGAAAFNAANPDHPDVPVMSIAGVSLRSDGGELCQGGALYDGIEDVDSVRLPLALSGLTIAGLDGRDNDGIVPTDSMVHGTFLGCVGADHLDEIGAPGGGLFVTFDHLAMYEDIVGYLRTAF